MLLSRVLYKINISYLLSISNVTDKYGNFVNSLVCVTNYSMKICWRRLMETSATYNYYT